MLRSVVMLLLCLAICSHEGEGEGRRGERKKTKCFDLPVKPFILHNRGEGESCTHVLGRKHS